MVKRKANTHANTAETMNNNQHASENAGVTSSAAYKLVTIRKQCDSSALNAAGKTRTTIGGATTTCRKVRGSSVVLRSLLIMVIEVLRSCLAVNELSDFVALSTNCVLDGLHIFSPLPWSLIFYVFEVSQSLAFAGLSDLVALRFCGLDLAGFRCLEWS